MALTKLTLEEIDGILQRATARRLHAELHIPDADNILFKKDQVQLALGHLSDKRDGTHVRKSRYDAINLKETYPTNPEAGTNTTAIINIATLTAGVPIVDAQPAADRVHEVQYIRAVCNAPFAANRQLQVSIYDAIVGILIYDSGVAALAGTEDGLVHPTDEFTVATTYPGTRNSFDIHNAAYLRFEAIGLVAAEEIYLYTHWKVKDAGGLR